MLPSSSSRTPSTTSSTSRVVEYYFVEKNAENLQNAISKLTEIVRESVNKLKSTIPLGIEINASNCPGAQALDGLLKNLEACNNAHSQQNTQLCEDLAQKNVRQLRQMFNAFYGFTNLNPTPTSETTRPYATLFSNREEQIYNYLITIATSFPRNNVEVENGKTFPLDQVSFHRIPAKNALALSDGYVHDIKRLVPTLNQSRKFSDIFFQKYTDHDINKIKAKAAEHQLFLEVNLTFRACLYSFLIISMILIFFIGLPLKASLEMEEIKKNCPEGDCPPPLWGKIYFIVVVGLVLLDALIHRINRMMRFLGYQNVIPQLIRDNYQGLNDNPPREAAVILDDEDDAEAVPHFRPR